MSITRQVRIRLDVLLKLEEWVRLDVDPRGLGEHRFIISVTGDDEAEAQQRLQDTQTALIQALQSGDDA